MIEKRFTTKYTNHYVLEVDIYDNDERISFYKTIDLLNELYEENQALKEKIAFLEEFITSGVEHTYSQNIYDENKQLKQSNKRLLKMLDNAANYMQKENKYIPIDDFVEWWNNIATKGLDGDVE